MPNLDGTGPIGQGPIGRGFFGFGRGIFQRRATGKGQGGSEKCVCPKCGYTQPHQRCVPCTEDLCPKCNTPMKGKFC